MHCDGGADRDPLERKVHKIGLSLRFLCLFLKPITLVGRFRVLVCEATTLVERMEYPMGAPTAGVVFHLNAEKICQVLFLRRLKQSVPFLWLGFRERRFGRGGISVTARKADIGFADFLETFENGFRPNESRFSAGRAGNFKRAAGRGGHGVFLL